MISSAWPIAARGEQLTYMQDRFNESESGLGWKLGLIAVMLVGVFGLFWLINHIQRRRAEPNRPRPMVLLFKAQGKLGLGLIGRFRLWQLVRVQKIPHPTSLLISPQLYDQAAEAYCGSRGWFGARTRAESGFAALREEIFGPPSPLGDSPHVP